MTYDPPCRSSTASIFTDWPATRVRMLSETLSPDWAPVPVSVCRVPPPTVVTLIRSVEDRTSALRSMAVTTGFVGSLRADGEREQGDDGEDETAHASQCTDGPDGRHPPSQTGRRAGKRTTSLIVSRPVSSITKRSIPNPSPPVGGMP